MHARYPDPTLPANSFGPYHGLHWGTCDISTSQRGNKDTDAIYIWDAWLITSETLHSSLASGCFKCYLIYSSSLDLYIWAQVHLKNLGLNVTILSLRAFASTCPTCWSMEYHLCASLQLRGFGHARAFERHRNEIRGGSRDVESDECSVLLWFRTPPNAVAGLDHTVTQCVTQRNTMR